MLLYLYSIEPPFYAKLNMACRSMDKEKLEMLGPYARALYELLAWGEQSDKLRNDAMQKGLFDGKITDHGKFSQTFFLYRGVVMPSRWFEDWQVKIGHSIKMPNQTSTSKYFEVALGFSKCTYQFLNLGEKSTIFVFLIQNYYGFPGFRLTQENYSAFPYEQEYLLEEKMSTKVIEIEKDLIINNPKLGTFKGCTISLVFLYNEGV